MNLGIMIPRTSSGGGGSVAEDEGKGERCKGGVSHPGLDRRETMTAALVEPFWSHTIARKKLSDVKVVMTLTDAESKCHSSWTWFSSMPYLCDSLMVPQT